MKKCLLVFVCLVLSTGGLWAEEKPAIVVNPLTSATGVELPYDLTLLQAQLVAELRVMLGKEFNIDAEVPASSPTNVYSLDCEITGWRPGNAAKRIVVGLGSGREASDVRYRVSDGSGTQVLERQDTVRTNYYSQGAGSIGTLVHPIAQKIAARIRDAKLK